MILKLVDGRELKWLVRLKALHKIEQLTFKTYIWIDLRGMLTNLTKCRAEQLKLT